MVDRSQPPRAGLCEGCRHRVPVPSPRGPVYVLCGRSRTDPRFPRYPVLPVLDCPGFEPAAPEPEAGTD